VIHVVAIGKQDPLTLRRVSSEQQGEEEQTHLIGDQEMVQKFIRFVVSIKWIFVLAWWSSVIKKHCHTVLIAFPVLLLISAVLFIQLLNQ
jgi:hypothetical protein